MKYLVLLAILAVVVLWFFGRGRGKAPPEPQAPPPPTPQAQNEAAAEADVTEILACAHCGVHLPRTEAAFDLVGRPYCSPEHRVSGPR